jgi:hypothetical protein
MRREHHPALATGYRLCDDAARHRAKVVGRMRIRLLRYLMLKRVRACRRYHVRHRRMSDWDVCRSAVIALAVVAWVVFVIGVLI